MKFLDVKKFCWLSAAAVNANFAKQCLSEEVGSQKNNKTCAVVSATTTFTYKSNDSYEYLVRNWKCRGNESKKNLTEFLHEVMVALSVANITILKKRGNKEWICYVNASVKNCCFRQEQTCRHKEINETNHETINIFVFLLIYMIAGVLSLAGNAVVFNRTLRVLHHRRNVLSTVQRVHNILLLNLAMADFLMGLYLSILALLKLLDKTGNFPEIRGMLRFTPLCSFLGILNFISSQVSVTMLVTMASFRLQSVRKPYKRVNERTATSSAALCWFVWLLLAIIPVINTDELQKIFVKQVKFQIISPSNVTQQTHDNVNYESLKGIVSNVLNASDTDCVLPASPSWSVLITLAKNFQLYGNETLLGFYNRQSWCGVNYMVNRNQPSDSYTLTIVSYNFVAFVYIAACYVYILCKTSNNNGCNNFKRYLNQVSAHFPHSSHEPENNEKGTKYTKPKEDEKMHKLIARILITDFICWVPLCLLSFSHAACSSPDSADKCLKGKRRLLSLICLVLVPLNSFVNPLLYSERLRNSLANVRMRLIGERLRTHVENIALTKLEI